MSDDLKKSGIGDGQDLLTKITHDDLRNEFDIDIGVKGLQLIDVVGYPKLETEIGISAEYRDNVPLSNAVNYDYDLEIIPNLKVKCDIVATTSSGVSVDKRTIHNNIRKIDGEKEILNLDNLDLPEKMVEFNYTPYLLLRSSEVISMGDVYNSWQQFDLSGGGANWQYKTSTDEIYNLNNQGNISGFYNPNDKELVNYNIDIEIFTDNNDDDMMGFAFRFQDENNFYSFQFDNGDSNGGLFDPNGARIFKKVDGTTTELARSSYTWHRHTWEDIRIEVKNDNFKVFANGSLILEANDSELTNGAFGPISRSQPDTYFRNLSVTGIDYEITGDTKPAALGTDGSKQISTKTYKELLEDKYNTFMSNTNKSFTKNGYYCRSNKPNQIDFNSSSDGNDYIIANAKDGVIWEDVSVTFNDISPGKEYIDLKWQSSASDVTDNTSDILIGSTDFIETKKYTGVVEKPLDKNNAFPNINQNFPNLDQIVVDNINHDTNFYKYYFNLSNNNSDADVRFQTFDQWKGSNNRKSVTCLENDFHEDTAQNMIVKSVAADTVKELVWNTNEEYFTVNINGFVVYPDVRKKDYSARVVDKGFKNYTQKVEINDKVYFLDFPIEMFDLLKRADKDFDKSNISIKLRPNKAKQMVDEESIDPSNVNSVFGSIDNSKIPVNDLSDSLIISSDYEMKIDEREIGWVSNNIINQDNIEKDCYVEKGDVWSYSVEISEMDNIFNYPPNLVEGSDELFVNTSSNVEHKIIENNGKYMIYVLKDNISGSLDWNPIIHSGYMYI